MFLFAWQILFKTDFILLPFFVAIWVLLAIFYRNIKYKNTVLYKYFLPALCFRLLGALLTALMYQYYYGYGDTYYYFFASRDIYNALLNYPLAAYDMLFVDFYNWDFSTSTYVTFRRIFTRPPEALVIKIAGLFSIFGFGTYIGTSFILTVFSFLGCWGIYRVFYDLYPHLHKPLAFAILFLPSMCFWSTGIMKDSLVIAGLGFYVYGIYFGLIKKKKKLIRSVFFIILGVWLMKTIKIYVLISILPASIIWVIFMFNKRIKTPLLRKILGPFFLGLGSLGAYLTIQQLGTMYYEYTLEGFIKEAAKTQWWLKLSTERDGGSGYDFGVIEPTLRGLLNVFPKAVIVTLFRPFLWETSKMIVFPSAIESTFTLCLTFYVIIKVGVLRSLISILRDPVILFCMVFAIIFAFCIGFTAYNFGALARYKIPCMPFYFIAMILLLDKGKQKKNLLRINRNKGKS
ncbi:MAG: hypothetical protein MK207_03025 [Saprospiraceae bacterium]|nr:hypothetical protein [Saprospiraceae bacterium]